MAEPLVSGEPARHRRLELLDVLRFVAALMVVCFHWLFNGISNGKIDSVPFTPLAPIAVYGLYGVHLFFLISGFVIAESARGKSSGQFVVSRGVRLFPAYWAAMLATTVVVNAWGTTELHVSVGQFLANLTMVPSLFKQPAVDGVYWTLTIELTFYLLVLVILLLGQGRHLDSVFPVWAVLMLLVLMFAPHVSSLPYLGGYYAFFASGAIIATIRRRGFSLLRALGLSAAMITAFTFVGRNLIDFNDAHVFRASPVVVFGLIAGFYVALCLLWIPRVGTLTIPLSRPVSDLTYPIYLLHAHIGYTVLQQLGTASDLWLVYPLMLIGLMIAAWLLHWCVEVKGKSFLYRGFGMLRRPFDSVQRTMDRFALRWTT
ncbi:acyltransferase family protein [Microbacterium sp. MMO-10]|uniref:acyltransferase family protein n=1 Tax=Microbacterium sp. MMO-10 TaxID=3081272 RepID=UPI003018D99A